MSDKEVAIRVHNVSKAFKLPHEKVSSIKSLFVSMFHGKRTYERQQVLKDVSFEIQKGEFFGIVGRNGSGKSTLLKMLAGIYTPDSGNVEINGKLTPFIELGVGFNPELTGRENVFLNGALLGFNREEIASMYDEIVEFAELERFMDQKLKNYSSGMQVRLAFAIAIRANTDILVLDEVLAVGDESFQRKCNSYFQELKAKGKTVILVTHDMESVKKFCDRALLIHEGRIVIEDSPERIAYEYSALNVDDTHVIKDAASDWGDKIVKIDRIHLAGNRQKNIVHTGDSFEMIIDYTNTSGVSRWVNYSLGVFKDGAKCFDISTYYSKPIRVGASSSGSIRVEFEDFRLLPGAYSCNMTIFDESMDAVHHGILDGYTIRVLGDAEKLKATGIVNTKSHIGKAG